MAVQVLLSLAACSYIANVLSASQSYSLYFHDFSYIDNLVCPCVNIFVLEYEFAKTYTYNVI